MTRAIANGADDGLVWLRLAQSELAAQDDHAMASAYNAYLKSTDPVERGAALFVIGRDYDRHDKQKEALAAFDAGLAFTRLPAIAERAEELRRLVAFRVTKVEVQAEAEAARVCLRFNEKIGTKGDISYDSYVRSEPKLDGIVTARGDTLCLDGMKHGAYLQRRDPCRAAGRRPASKCARPLRPASSFQTASRKSGFPEPATSCRRRTRRGCR